MSRCWRGVAFACCTHSILVPAVLWWMFWCIRRNLRVNKYFRPFSGSTHVLAFLPRIHSNTYALPILDNTSCTRYELTATTEVHPDIRTAGCCVCSACHQMLTLRLLLGAQVARHSHNSPRKSCHGKKSAPSFVKAIIEHAEQKVSNIMCAEQKVPNMARLALD